MGPYCLVEVRFPYTPLLSQQGYPWVFLGSLAVRGVWGSGFRAWRSGGLCWGLEVAVQQFLALRGCRF